MSSKKNDYFDITGSGRFDFLGKEKFFIGLSVLVVLASSLYIWKNGLNYGIDFKGGTEIQVQFQQNVEVSQVRSFLEKINIPDPQIQKFGGGNEFLVRFQNPMLETAKATNEYLQTMVTAMTSGFMSEFASVGPEIRRIDTVGPQVGSQLKKNSLLAVFYSLLVILIYVGLRFDYIFAPGAVVCLFHDAIVTMGVLAVLGKEINIQILAAILTIIGYSLNDTIIIFDRVRETLHIYEDKSLPWIINKAINDTLNRTITTSVCTLVATVSLYVFTEGVIKDFALAMSIGIVFGTYSTMYIASPMVILFDRIQRRKKVAA